MTDARESTHPTEATLLGYGWGTLDAASAGPVRRHVGACPTCRRRLEELTGAGTADEPFPAELVDHPDYEVVRELGRGGMGVVYLARNKLMGRLEVLKVVGRHLIERPNVLERFLREIRSAAKLQHQNIVSAYSAMRLGDGVALAMEYVEGEDLAKLVKARGALPVTNACYYVYQAALGLQHAHERGMVHRDIKPANLILAREGTRAVVKVLDFGLAKVASEGQVDGGLTHEGQMLGTPDYVAPEQTLDAQKADIRADIYSLGCTFYYLLTGGPPFRGKSLYDLLQAHQSTDARPLNLVRPEVSDELAALVARMLAKDPDHRFQTPGEVAQALTRFLRPGSSPPPRSGDEHAAVGPRTPPAGATPPPPAERPRAKTVVEGDALTGLIALDEAKRPGPRGKGGPVLRRFASVVALVAVLVGLYAQRSRTPGPAVTPTGPGPGPRNPVRTTGGQPPTPKPVRPSAPGPVVREPEAPATPRVVAALSSNGRPTAPERVRPGDPAGPGEGKAGGVDPGPEEPTKGVALARVTDFRRLKAEAGVTRLADAASRRPPGPFWPALTPVDVRAWQIADAGAVKMTEKGLFVSAGPAGNFLLTRRSDYGKVAVKVGLAVSRGTEAYVALRADDGSEGWRAATSRVADDGGTVRAGLQGVDFLPEGPGAGRKDFAPDKRFLVTFEDDGRGTRRVLVNGKETSKVAAGHGPGDDQSGSAGLFVKSGTVMIESLTVEP